MWESQMQFQIGINVHLYPKLTAFEQLQKQPGLVYYKKCKILIYKFE